MVEKLNLWTKQKGNLDPSRSSVNQAIGGIAQFSRTWKLYLNALSKEVKRSLQLKWVSCGDRSQVRMCLVVSIRTVPNVRTGLYNRYSIVRFAACFQEQWYPLVGDHESWYNSHRNGMKWSRVKMTAPNPIACRSRGFSRVIEEL